MSNFLCPAFQRFVRQSRKLSFVSNREITKVFKKRAKQVTERSSLLFITLYIKKTKCLKLLPFVGRGRGASNDNGLGKESAWAFANLSLPILGLFESARHFCGNFHITDRFTFLKDTFTIKNSAVTKIISISVFDATQWATAITAQPDQIKLTAFYPKT